MMESPKDRSGFIKRPRFNLAKQAAERTERDLKHGHEVEQDEKEEEDKVDKRESVQKVIQQYGVEEEKGNQSSTRHRMKNQFYPGNDTDTMSDMGSIQSQAQSMSMAKPKRSTLGMKKISTGDPRETSESPPKRLDVDSQVNAPQQIDDFDSDYEDDFIPDTTEIKKRANESFRDSRKAKEENLIDDYVHSDEELENFSKFRGNKPSPKTTQKPRYRDIDKEYSSETEPKSALKKKTDDSRRDRSRFSSNSRQKTGQSSHTREEGEDLHLPPISTPKGSQKYKNITPRYLKEYRKRKSQGEKLREENKLNKSLKMGRNQKRPTQKGMSQNKRVASTPVNIKPKPRGKPANLDYLNRLAQPKAKAKYVVMNEETSSEAEGEGEEGKDRSASPDNLKPDNKYKKTPDLSQIISRESPRLRPGRGKKMKEVKPFKRRSSRIRNPTQKPKKLSVKNIKNEKEKPKEVIEEIKPPEPVQDPVFDPSKPLKSSVVSQIVKKMVSDTNGQQVTMQQLRLIEEWAATQIQKIIRGGMTRKWYRAYKRSKKFGVPFSGIEINKDPFLRQFAKLNMDLHLDFIREGEEKDKNLQDETEAQALQKLRNEMENDETLFVYNTIKNKKPKKILKGTKLTDINKNFKEEFLKNGLGAYDGFRRVHATLNGEEQPPNIDESEQKPEAEGEQEAEGEGEEKPKTPEGPKVPQIKLTGNTDFIEDPETIEYLQKVKFLNIKKRREEGKSDKQILDELDHEDGLDAEQKMLKSIMKNTVEKELDQEPDPSKRRQVKASELVHEKRKPQEGTHISSNFALRSGIQIPETQEAKEKRIKEEEKKAKDEQWNKIMNPDTSDPNKDLDMVGNMEFKDLQNYSREPIVLYKRISGSMIRWTISAGKVFDKHGYFFIPIKIIGSQLGQRSMIIKSIIYLELMRFPKSAVMDKDFETIWPFLLYLLNNWIRHQFNIMGITDSKELEERIIKRKEQHEREIREGKTEEE